MRLKSIFLLLCLCFCVNAFANNEPITQLWQFKMAGVNKTIVDGSGHVYVLNEYQNNMKLYAVSDDGKAKWHLDLPHQVYAQPCVDRDGNVYLYGQDASVTSVTPNGSIKWRINLPTMKNEIANTDIPLAAGLVSSFIYASTKDGNIYAVYSNGHAQKIYTPREQASLVAAPVEAPSNPFFSLTFALNFEKNSLAEIHQVSSDNHNVQDKVLARFTGKIDFFSREFFSPIMYGVLSNKDQKTKLLLALDGYGDKLWSRTINSDQAKFVQREDVPNYFRKLYYTDIENKKPVIYGIDQLGNVIFKTEAQAKNISEIFPYKNNLITVNQTSNDGHQSNIQVFDRASGKKQCESAELSIDSPTATNLFNKVFLASSKDVSAFETCVKD